ncbi:MAG: energy transducer TonB [Bdellovibrionota bacterium]
MTRFVAALDSNVNYLRQGFFISFIFHCLILLSFWQSAIKQNYSVPNPIKITFKNSTQQIVTPPDLEPTTEAPLDTNKLSDKNFITKKEQIKRGDSPDAARVAVSQNKPDNKPINKASENIKPKKNIEPKQQAAKSQGKPQKLKTLALDSNTLFSKFGSESPQKTNPDKPLDTGLNNYRAFSRPPGSGAAIIGQAGVSDFIPNLPDGDITMLNAKADRFAVFVRRVAVRVFGSLRTVGWEQIRAIDVRSIRDFSTVHATLDKQGKLIDITLEGESGSYRFDKVLLQAAQNTQDPNPPPEAIASDGNYHFIFKSRSWVSVYSGQKGLPVERRWLLLATGLL